MILWPALSVWVEDGFTAFPSSGVFHFTVADAGTAIENVLLAYCADALSIIETDGVNLAFDD
jgi:phosphomannomutase